MESKSFLISCLIATADLLLMLFNETWFLGFVFLLSSFFFSLPPYDCLSQIFLILTQQGALWLETANPFHFVEIKPEVPMDLE
jgi:hypothetical protein